MNDLKTHDPKTFAPRIIVALDFDNQQQVISLIENLDPALCRLKVGKELFTACGPDIVKRVQDSGFDVFLDLKFHDIPATVAKACKSAAKLGVWMLNVHASGGASMMSAAKNAIAECENSPYLIAVTVLTSMGQSQLTQIGVNTLIEKQVINLAALAKTSGLDGVVCSAMEAEALRATLGQDFLLVTPGIRPEGSDVNDQKRIMTPIMALNSGADYLVIGRPITQSANPLVTLNDIQSTIVNQS